jgi:glycosyltransferase involved in cell wall biosynthesis
MRPLWLTEAYPPHGGGMAQSCDRIVRGLRGDGVAVDVVHLSPRYARMREDEGGGGRLLRCPLGDDPAHALHRAWNAVSARAETAGWTHVVAFGGTLPLLGGPAFAAWLGLPLVTLLRGNDFDTGLFAPGRAAALHEAVRRSAAVGAVSREMTRRVEALHPGTRAVWTPNGIDTGEWALTAGDRRRAAAWRAAHVAEGRRVLGLFGQLKPKKGGLFLLDALLRSGHADRFHLLLVGDLDPEMSAWLVAHAERLHATVLPFADRWELLPLYGACDWVAIPSFYDGMPNVLLEAMGLGIPLVASAAGGMADVLADGEHALLFAPGDPHGCRRVLERAASTGDGERGAMGERCRARAAEFTPAAETATIHGLLAAAAGPR